MNTIDEENIPCARIQRKASKVKSPIVRYLRMMSDLFFYSEPWQDAHLYIAPPTLISRTSSCNHSRFFERTSKCKTVQRVQKNNGRPRWSMMNTSIIVKSCFLPACQKNDRTWKINLEILIVLTYPLYFSSIIRFIV